MLKNALSRFKIPKNKRIEPTIDMESLKNIGQIRSFRSIISEYFSDVAFNNGEDSQKIYEKFQNELIRVKKDEYYPYAEQQYEKALEIIDNYREWEAEKLGWK